MRIYTKAGDLAFREFEFSDTQPHFRLEVDDSGFREATIEAPIRTAQELLKVIIAADTLNQLGYAVDLDIRYLLGARMDRSISAREPFTLRCITRMIKSAPLRKIRVLDAHSSVATTMLGAENVLPFGPVQAVLATLGKCVVVIPDKGATDRVNKLTFASRSVTVQAEKQRNVDTGAIVGTRLHNTSLLPGQKCLIIDDIIDGGATFVATAKALREFGASEVHLFATHAILNKGLRLEGIDTIYTTDSYRDWQHVPFGPTCIPVRMEDMK